MAKRRTRENAGALPEKAYKNLDFLNSPAARHIRVLSEFVEPGQRFRNEKVKDTIVFFGSARMLPRKTAKHNLRRIENELKNKARPSKELKEEHKKAKYALEMSRYYEDAVRLSEKLTSWSLGLPGKSKRFAVCSGGGPGIMEAANRGAIKAGGKSIGLNISLPMEQIPNKYQTRNLSFIFHYFFIRKFWFIYLAKALVMFPGGYGTMDELFEILTLVQTGKTRKYMPIVIYGPDYWKKLIDFDMLLEWGMIDKADLKLFAMFDDVDEAFEYLKRELTKHYLQ
jgi:uncharacterized protein (TIGR00730 family)